MKNFLLICFIIIKNILDRKSSTMFLWKKDATVPLEKALEIFQYN